VAENHPRERWTLQQIGAVVSIFIITAWSIVVFLIHACNPLSADTRELSLIGTAAVVSLLSIPFYLKRIKWSYAGGILVTILLFVGAIMIALNRAMFFSPSVYNILVIVVYVVAFACLYFSISSLRQRKSGSRRTTIIGVCGTILVFALIASSFLTNQSFMRQFTVKSTIERTYNQLETIGELENKIEYLRQLGDIPSLTAGIVVDDSLVWIKGLGEQEGLDTVYNIGSVTKPIIATGILQLQERGLVNLDDEASNYLPFQLVHPDYPEKPITIHMLLSHQSGLNSRTIPQETYFNDEDMIEWMVEKQGWTFTEHDLEMPLGEFLENYLVPDGLYYSPDVWASVEPGTQFVYANSGYYLLRYIMENVTGQSIHQYLQENIFDPLGMTDTGLSFSDAPEKQAIPYLRLFGVLSKTNAELPLYDKVVGAGGIRSTVPDLARFMIANLNSGQINGTQLVKPETVSLLHNQVVSSTAVTNMISTGLGFDKLREGPGQYWGHQYNMHGALGHQGGDFGCNNEWWFVDKEQGGYGVIMLTNVNTYKHDEALVFATYYKILTLLMDEAADRYQQQLG
jgi:CubicO group peptidase (beta-lactamase class C family)